MTSIQLFLNQTQKVGPFHIWPMKCTGLSSLKYQVPPNIGQLLFREYDEGDGPDIGRVEVFNPTAVPVLIPCGWVVGGDLHQVRVFNSTELVMPMESILANVTCVEQGRFSEGKTEVDGGRAPISVHVSGRVFNPSSERWSIETETRQQSVWNRVATMENRGGTRPTSSLQQIMKEDSLSLNTSLSLKSSFENSLRILNGQNSILIAFEGEPLLLESFSSVKALRTTIQSTILSLSFDIEHLDFEATTKEKVRDFIEMATVGKLAPAPQGLSNSHFLSGCQNVDTNALSDSDGRLLHITAINREHRILQEVK